MPTDYQRLGTGRKYGDLVFSPGDDTKPPLLTVPIGPKPEPRKETIAVRRVIDPQVKDEALRLLQAGVSVHDVAAETGIAEPTLRKYKADLKRGLQAPVPMPMASEDKAANATPEPPTEAVKEAQPAKPNPADFVTRLDPMERALTASSPAPAETAQERTLRIVLDPDSANRALEQAMERWMSSHMRTHFDGTRIHVDLPPVPTRWVVQATAVSMTPEEDA